MRIIAFVLDPPTIERILLHIGQPAAAPPHRVYLPTLPGCGKRAGRYTL